MGLKVVGSSTGLAVQLGSCLSGTCGLCRLDPVCLLCTGRPAPSFSTGRMLCGWLRPGGGVVNPCRPGPLHGHVTIISQLEPSVPVVPDSSFPTTIPFCFGGFLWASWLAASRGLFSGLPWDRVMSMQYLFYLINIQGVFQAVHANYNFNFNVVKSAIFISTSKVFDIADRFQNKTITNTNIDKQIDR